MDPLKYSKNISIYFEHTDSIVLNDVPFTVITLNLNIHTIFLSPLTDAFLGPYMR